MKKLSVVINTKNAAQSLRRTLESVQFADEVLVADMASTDETRAIANKMGARVISVKDCGRVEPEARNEANAAVTGEWTLQVDADEVISEQLQVRIMELIAPSTEIMGFNLPRKNIIFGQWIQHTGWWPDYQLRLFKTGSLVWTEGVHSKPTIHGQAEDVPALEELAIIHENYVSVSEYIDRLNRYTTLQANEAKTATSHMYITTFSGEFFRRYFHLEGWKDGETGLVLSLLQSMYEVVVDAKKTELEGKLSTQKIPLPEKDLRQLASDIKYWLADYHLHHERSSIAKLYWRMRRKARV